MSTNLRQYVEPPGFTNTPYGLTSYVDWRPDSGDNHWRAGITYEPICGAALTTNDPCIVTGTSGAGLTKSQTGFRTTRAALPITVFAEVDCAPVGHWDDAEAFAQQMFLRNESFALEKAFWTGIISTRPGDTTGVYPHLAANAQVLDSANSLSTIVLQPAATVVTGIAVDPTEGLGRLEKALGTAYNGIGFIHAPVETIPHLSTGRLIQEGQIKLRTWNGNYVVAGTGYPGTGPDGTDPGVGKAWMYATGQLFGYRGPIKTIPLMSASNGSGPGSVGRAQLSLDRTVNTTKVLVERQYVVSWDCSLFAILVSTGGQVTGSANSPT